MPVLCASVTCRRMAEFRRFLSNSYTIIPRWHLASRGKSCSPGVSTAWLSVIAAAAWQHLYVRRRMVKSEAERDRYQHAMHFVTHEMRTPLTAIQGSSELMSRYALTDEKRQQVALLIHSE